MDLHVFFKEEVKPALGCTEPGAVALAAAVASKAFLGSLEKIEDIALHLSANIYKNGHNVGIPGAHGLKGNRFAAALGVIAGDPAKGLQVLAGINEDHILKAQDFLDRGIVKEHVQPHVPDVYAEVAILGENHSAVAIISGRHDHIVELRVDGKAVPRESGDATETRKDFRYLEELRKEKMEGLWSLCSEIDEEIEKFLLEGVAMNLKVASMRLKESLGLGVGYVLACHANSGDLLWKIKATAGAAADVRMSGAPYPVMSSAGSGNHGITAILPVAVVAESRKSSPRELAESIALSHLVTGYIKCFTGRLTPVCGCAVAAGAGAAAGIVRLLGGTPSQAESAVASLVASLLGMLCDGAKGSCALKVSTAAGEAYTSALLAMNNHGVVQREGIIDPRLEFLAPAVAVLSTQGFASVDSTVLQLLQEGDDAESSK